MLLQINKLRKEYQRGTNYFYAVDNVDLNMRENDFISIIGRSGSGKTTLLNMIAGILSPTSGGIMFNNIDIGELNDGELSLLRNKYIGYIPQGSSLLGNLSVLDNVRLPFYLGSPAGQDGADLLARARELLAEAGLSHLQNMYPASLSGGEARRVAIARALINSPKLLIADEPTSDLDMETSREIMRLLLKAHQAGTALLLVTHDSAITGYGGSIIKMESGRITG